MIRFLIIFFCVIFPAHAGGRLVVHDGMAGQGLPPMRVTVWLPDQYDMGRSRFDVLYMQDGQNVFDKARSYGGVEWGADEWMEKFPGHIIVAVDNLREKRAQQYLPAKVYDRLSPAAQDALKSFGRSGPLLSDAYIAFLAKDLKPFIDKTYRTNPGRDHTAVMGSSMGGLISLYAFAEYPDVFGKAGCLSTHWPLFFGEKGNPVPFATEVTAAFTGYVSERLGPPQGRRIWFDHGTETLDAIYAPYQTAVDAQLLTLGWVKGRDFVSHAYEGAEHNEAAWNARLGDVLGFLYRPVQ